MLAALLLSLSVASANPAEPIANAGDVPALSKLLERTGWVPTPELTGNIRVGDVFASTSRGQQWQAEGCMDAQPRSAPYTEVEVSMQLQLGVSVRVGLIRAGADTNLTKVIRFGEPEHQSLPGLGLALNDTCKGLLAGQVERGVDLRSWYIVKEVMVAEITQQTCGEVDANGRFVAFGAGTDLAQSCAQSSNGKVAVAWRTVSLVDLDPSLMPSHPAAATAPNEGQVTKTAASTSISADIGGAPPADTASPGTAALVNVVAPPPTKPAAAPPPSDASRAPISGINGVRFRSDGYYQCLVPLWDLGLVTQPIGLLMSTGGHWWMFSAMTARGLDRNYGINRVSIDNSAEKVYFRSTSPLPSLSLGGALVELQHLSAHDMVINLWWQGANMLNGPGVENLTCNFQQEY
jgi:hypothetical protein